MSEARADVEALAADLNAATAAIAEHEQQVCEGGCACVRLVGWVSAWLVGWLVGKCVFFSVIVG